MSTSELLLLLFIALIAFHPKKWPMLAYHAAKMLKWLQHYKQKAHDFFNMQIALYELEKNKEKAAKVDELLKR